MHELLRYASSTPPFEQPVVEALVPSACLLDSALNTSAATTFIGVFQALPSDQPWVDGAFAAAFLSEASFSSRDSFSTR